MPQTQSKICSHNLIKYDRYCLAIHEHSSFKKKKKKEKIFLKALETLYQFGYKIPLSK